MGIEDEVIHLLDAGGIYAYCNDIQETLQYLGKDSYLKFSGRGNLKGGHPGLVMMQRQFMRTYVCICEGGPQKIFMLKEELKERAAILSIL